jgi:uncharacterized protein (DUF2384 family)
MDVSIKAPAIWKHAVEVFGSERKASSWFQTQLAELGDRTPEQVLSQDPDSVEAVLDRIDYGVFI